MDPRDRELLAQANARMKKHYARYHLHTKLFTAYHQWERAQEHHKPDTDAYDIVMRWSWDALFEYEYMRQCEGVRP